MITRNTKILEGRKDTFYCGIWAVIDLICDMVKGSDSMVSASDTAAIKI